MVTIHRRLRRLGINRTTTVAKSLTRRPRPPTITTTRSRCVTLDYGRQITKQYGPVTRESGNQNMGTKRRIGVSISLLAALTVTWLLTASLARAQQINGVPGSPSS